MASHPAYPHPGPGPSSYYQQPPPHPHVYGTHSQYHHQPGPSRGNHRGANHLGGSYNSRGTHHYHHNYQQPHQQQPHFAHSHVNPALGSAKYNQPFTPSYPYPSPTAPQQPISPLPKQLSMPPPQNNGPAAPPKAPEPTENPETPTSSYSHMGTISTTDTTSPAPSRSASPSPGKAVNPIAKWAICIIISPKARPPPDVVQQALDLKTPPPSAPASPAPVVSKLPPATEVRFIQARPSASSSAAGISTISVAAAWASQTNSSVPSSSVTENADTPTVPGSPASSHTSIPTQAAEADVAATVIATSTSTASSSTLTPASPAPAATSTSSAPVSSPSVQQTDMLAAPLLAAPPHARRVLCLRLPAPVAAPPKKSWASLLRPAAASPTSPPGPSRNALPTSSVSALATLLTSGPAAAAALRIRPRGLVNSGNMCFANAVLQVLVYCPPFHRLFAELGRVLVGPVVGGGGGAGVGAKEERVGAVAAQGSATPLVDATIEFLREFAEDRKKRDRARLEVVSRNGVGAGGSGRGKGKEREVRGEAAAAEEEDDWDGDSFLPTYIYDAMKEKKRFDNMRGGHQEDAEEFFGFYLDTLEEELLAILHSVHPPKGKGGAAGGAVEETEEAAPPEEDGWLEVGRRNKMVVTRTVKATESPITRIFGGKFRSTLRAPGQKDSVVVEDWRSLRLDIQRDQIHTIQDALSYISDPQPVQVTQAARPGITIEAHQQVLIEALPPILVLHIKRFCYDTAVGGVVKVGKQVRFGPELEIGANIMVPAAKKAQPARYKLFGALYHHGVSASGGHYTLDVLHPNRYPNVNPGAKPREGWVRIDDDLVSDVRPEDVFGAAERDDARCAYLLFYRRI
ncbi:hypothetical protein BJ912DRAFT_1082179 [Pholiota molesta]|nr:hypothetical protein BJ912DRAFT_1082179 [Pholiota molesta]